MQRPTAPCSPSLAVSKVFGEDSAREILLRGAIASKAVPGCRSVRDWPVLPPRQSLGSDL